MGFLQSVVNLVAAGDAAGGNAVGFPQFHQVRAKDGGGRVTLFVEELLPLAHHAQEAIADDRDFDGHLFLDDGAQLLHGHLEATVTHHGPHLHLRTPYLSADGRGHPIAHRAQPARGQQLVGMFVDIVLSFPHLMLPHVGGDDGVALGDVPEFAHHMGRNDVVRLGVGNVALFPVRLPFPNLPPPLGMPLLLDEGQEGLQGFLRVADNGHRGGHVLAHFRGVEFEVDDLGLGRELVQFARDAVVEAHTNGDEDVTVLNGQVGAGLTVHPAHAQGQGMGFGDAADAEQGGRHGDVGLFGQGLEFALRVGHEHAVAGDDEGAFGVVDQIGGLADGFHIDRGGTFEAGNVDVVGVGQGDVGLRNLDILTDVHQHGPRPPRARDLEGGSHHPGQVVDVGDQEVVLGDGEGHTDDIRLLEGVVSQQGGGHLARDGDDGDGIHHGGGQAGDEVERTGARSRHAHADFARGAGVAVGHVGRALLVAGQHVADGVLGHRVVGGQNCTTWVAEEHVHSLGQKRLPHNVCASTFLTHNRLLLEPMSESPISSLQSPIREIGDWRFWARDTSSACVHAWRHWGTPGGGETSARGSPLQASAPRRGPL